MKNQKIKYEIETVGIPKKFLKQIDVVISKISNKAYYIQVQFPFRIDKNSIQNHLDFQQEGFQEVEFEIPEDFDYGQKLENSVKIRFHFPFSGVSIEKADKNYVAIFFLKQDSYLNLMKEKNNLATAKVKMSR